MAGDIGLDDKQKIQFRSTEEIAGKLRTAVADLQSVRGLEFHGRRLSREAVMNAIVLAFLGKSREDRLELIRGPLKTLNAIVQQHVENRRRHEAGQSPVVQPLRRVGAGIEDAVHVDPSDGTRTLPHRRRKQSLPGRFKRKLKQYDETAREFKAVKLIRVGPRIINLKKLIVAEPIEAPLDATEGAMIPTLSVTMDRGRDLKLGPRDAEDFMFLCEPYATSRTPAADEKTPPSRGGATDGVRVPQGDEGGESPSVAPSASSVSPS